MARYFFHLRDHESSVLDPEGLELNDIMTAREKANPPATR